MYIMQPKLITLLQIKNKANNNKKVVCQLHSMQLQSPAVKKGKAPKNAVVKRCDHTGQ